MQEQTARETSVAHQHMQTHTIACTPECTCICTRECAQASARAWYRADRECYRIGAKGTEREESEMSDMRMGIGISGAGGARRLSGEARYAPNY